MMDQNQIMDHTKRYDVAIVVTVTNSTQQELKLNLIMRGKRTPGCLAG